MRVKLENRYGAEKQVKLGFSWTTFFFGIFTPMLRGDLKWTAIVFVTNFLLALFTYGIGNIFTPIFFGYFYNKFYLKDLLAKGYTPTTELGDHAVNNYLYQ